MTAKEYPEPVAWLDLKKLSVGGMAYATSRNANSRQVPLYTTPPSVDALIADAVAKERKACAQIGEAFDKERPQSNYGRCIAVAIRARRTVWLDCGREGTPHE